MAISMSNWVWLIKWVPENLYTFSMAGYIVNVYKFSGTHFNLLYKKVRYSTFTILRQLTFLAVRTPRFPSLHFAAISSSLTDSSSGLNVSEAKLNLEEICQKMR